MTARPLSVVHILAPAPIGGMETVVYGLAREQHRRGHQVLVMPVLHEAPEGHPFVAALKRDGVPVSAVVIPVRGYRRERSAVRRHLDATAPDVFHTHGYRPDLVDAPVARGRGIATVTTAHGFSGGGLKGRAYEWLQTRAFAGFDAVVAVSHPLRDRLERNGVDPSRLHLIQNAWVQGSQTLERVESKRVLAVPETGPVVGWVGRFTQEKGADLMLRAFAMVEDPTATLSLLGAGPQEEELRSLARRLGIANRVRWHGIVEDAQRLFSAFDVFALSSRTEGTPMVLLEAMAASVPIVATAVGGVPDLVSDAEALLTKPGDPVSLADAIRSVLSDSASARLRASAAHSRLEIRFSVDQWLNRYEEAYEAAML